MKVIQRGNLTKVAGSTGAAGAAIATAVVTPKELSGSFGSVITDLLDANTGAALIVVDLRNRKVYSATDAAKRGALHAAVDSNSDETTTFTPDAGQSGKTLSFASDSAIGGALGTAVDALVVEVKPKRSVENLVSAIISALPENIALEALPIIEIDQIAGNVRLVTPVTTASVSGAALAAVAPAATDLACVAISEDVAVAGASPLAFEGGAV